MTLLDLEGKTAFITGAGQGVGRQIALHFAEHNAGVVGVNDYSLERAEAVAEEIRSAGGKAVPLQADVTDFDALGTAFEKLRKEAGPPDLLVNNAGNAGADPSKVSRAPFWEQSPENWSPFLHVNLHGVMHCCRLAVPGMIEKKGGSIVTVISDAGRVGEPNLEVYSGAKAGAAGFSRALAKSLGRYDVRVNCVAIAATITPTTERGFSNPDVAKKMLGSYVLRRFGQPTDAANLVLFLSSGAASWITGQTYPVNGGYSFAV